MGQCVVSEAFAQGRTKAEAETATARALADTSAHAETGTARAGEAAVEGCRIIFGSPVRSPSPTPCGNRSTRLGTHPETTTTKMEDTYEL
jgi:hypothetical protein